MEQIKRLQGFWMPAEFEAHDGCLLIWPVRAGSWTYGGAAAKKAFFNVIDAISQSEQVYVLTDAAHLQEARAALSALDNVTVLEIQSDDAWARDVGPTFVINDKGERIGIDWAFNAWGGEVDGLYAHWDKDDKVASLFCKAIETPCFDAHPFVLEGGSIHADGEGTILTTEACLLSAGRNPCLSKEQIEQTLCETLGAQKVVWIPYGIVNDETNEHVDNVCAFVRPSEVVLAWTDDPTDPQYAPSHACEQALNAQTDAKGRKITVYHLPIPKQPILIQEQDLQGYVFEEGEDVREVGERLAASYVNFYLSNGGVVVPQFGDENDAVATCILGELFPERTVYPIAARDILLGGGNIHCITQQIPTPQCKISHTNQ